MSEQRFSALHNSFVKLTRDKRLKIVVIGNSVSDGGPVLGQGQIVADWFAREFPDAQIEIQEGIIYAIGPELQLFRMEEKLFAQEPDLAIVEFSAANNAWGDAGKEVTDRAAEGYLRRLRFMRPQVDCLMNMGVFQSMLDIYRAGETPHAVTFLRDIAAHYGVALADTQKELMARMLAGDPWEQYMKDGIHANDAGYVVHGNTVVAELARQYALFQATPEDERTLRNHPFPQETVHPDPWLFPRYDSALLAESWNGFTVGESGRVKFLEATEAGAEGSFTTARGHIVGVLLGGPEDRGNVEVRADGGDWVRLTQLRQPCFTERVDPDNRYQRHIFGPAGLPLYSTRIDFRVSADPEVPNTHHVRIVAFLVIERPAQMDFARG